MNYRYTEAELIAMPRAWLWEIVVEIAMEQTCLPEDIAPAKARKELLVSSILEAQKEVGESSSRSIPP
jgi:hypothetical protein